MNKIVLDTKLNDQTNDDVEVLYQKSSDLFDISSLIININNKTALIIDLNLSEDKLNVELNVNYDVNLYIMCQGSDLKIKYHYSINNNAECRILKYNRVKHINEMCLIDLNSQNSSINYLFKSISNMKENYDYVVNHNAKNTISNITNNGVNKDGEMNIQISGYVFPNITGCICNQTNRIINLTNNRCEIRPNLYIDCDDVDANHSALIGKFSDDEMFYLNSRGINSVDATNLLIKGFLLNGIDNKKIYKQITNDIDKYWR